MMNKICIRNNIINLENNHDYFLSIDHELMVTINVLPNVIAKLVIVSMNSTYTINYNLHTNSQLTINALNYDINGNININLLEDNSSVIYNYSVVSNKNSNSNFNINHLSNNSSSIINNNGVNLNDNKLYFNINGIIPKERQKINCIQNSKIVNIKNGDSKIIPNLIIDSNDITATHSAYIGSFDKKVKYYMLSRGLCEKTINLLLYKALLLGNMPLSDESEEFNKIINEWW